MAKLTKFPNGLSSWLLDSNAVEKTAAYTVVANTDAGKTFTNGGVDGVVFTLPSIANGNTVTFVNTGIDGQAALSVSPAALDAIYYAGSAVDNKDIINTKATAKQGDFITLASLADATGWHVVASRGIWAKEA